MRVLELTGKVTEEAFGPTRPSRGGKLSGPLVGDRHIVAAIRETFPDIYPGDEQHDWDNGKRLTVILAVGGSQELYAGKSEAEYGEKTWSDLTPGSPPTMTVGSMDLIGRLNDLAGQTVTIRIDDGPPLPNFDQLRPAPSTA